MNPVFSANMQTRIQTSHHEFTKLQNDREIKNTFLILRKVCTDQMLLDFISGKASVEECAGGKCWIINLLKTNSCFQIKTGWFDDVGTHYLSENYVKLLTETARFGWFENQDKFTTKFAILLDKIATKNERINFRSSDLRHLDLNNADLSHADLSGADLSGTNLQNADLYGASLENAFVLGTDFTETRGLPPGFNKIQENNQKFLGLKNIHFKNLIQQLRKACTDNVLALFISRETTLENCTVYHASIRASLKKNPYLQPKKEYFFDSVDSHYLSEGCAKTLDELSSFSWTIGQNKPLGTLALLENIVDK